MRTGIVLMALGVCSLALLPSLPDSLFVAFLPLAILSAWLKPAPIARRLPFANLRRLFAVYLRERAC